ncbi:hypothetical protein HJFPF1_09518 [Paramyrothecium foliicola]|nr:hypothetical protein HJFPF1_09518 [Paramyrothecium foliicola]
MSLRESHTSNRTMERLKNFATDEHKNLFTISCFLYCLDPVRGEATTYSIDKHPVDNSWRHDNLQRKFLDSIAFISSTLKKGGDTASAVCLEHGDPEGPVLRLARNTGVTVELMRRLELILADLRTAPVKGSSPIELKSKVLLQIIELDWDKIESLLFKIRKKGVEDIIGQARTAMETKRSATACDYDRTFQDWISHIPAFFALSPDTTPRELASHLKWASHAKWVHSDRLQALFGTKEGLPPWLQKIHKLGRYYAAARFLTEFAQKEPKILKTVRIKPVEAPPKQCFRMREKDVLVKLLARLQTNDREQLMVQLGKFWCNPDPAAYFQDACCRKLAVHAEMQLLGFYDSHPESTPQFLFMGTSKKACYLCYKFLSQHSPRMAVSACHQKIYPSWMPWQPRLQASNQLKEKHKNIQRQIIRQLETTAKSDVANRLGLKRPANLDSTAGPSLSLSSNFLCLSVIGQPETGPYFD